MTAPLDIAALVKRLRDIAEVDDEQVRGYPATMWQAADAIELLARDAARYRWLRVHRTHETTDGVGLEYYPHNTSLDAAIDAAIAQQGEP